MPVVIEVQMGRHFFVEPPNCYATFTYEGKEFRTDTHHGATNPKWPNCKCEIGYEGKPIELDVAVMQRKSREEQLKIASATIRWENFVPGLRKVSDYPVTAEVEGVRDTAAIRVAATLIPEGITGSPQQREPRRKALFVGIQYAGTPGYLMKCHEDAPKMKDYFCTHYGWLDSPETVKVLMDADNAPPSLLPTKENIKYGIKWLVDEAIPGDSLLFFYSGHGSQVPNYNDSEKDGYDEALCPVDMHQSGLLIDDELNEMLVQPLPAGVRLTCILDACHSGTGLDLPFHYQPGMEEATWELDQGGYYSAADVICVSAAADDETAKNCPVMAMGREDFPCGAFAASWLVACEVHETQVRQNWKEMMDVVNTTCADFRQRQTAQLSSSQKFDLTREFSFHDIIGNSNEQLGPVRNGTNPFTAGDPDQDFRAQLARQMMMQSGAPADMIMQSGPPVDETQQRAEFARQLLMQSGGPMDEAREVGARGAPSTRRMRMRAKGPEVQMSYEEFVAAIQSRGDGASPQYVAMMEEMTGYKAPPGSIANEY